MSYLIRFWPYAAGLVLIVAAYLWAYDRGAKSREPEIAALRLTIANVRAKTAQAQADDALHARTVEIAQDTKTQEIANGLQARMDAANAMAASYAKRVRDDAQAAAGGGSGAAHLPGSANAASGTVEARAAALLDEDAVICSTNTVLLDGWRDWWLRQAAIQR